MSLPSLPVHNRNKTDDITSRSGYSMIKYGCFLVVALILLCILFVIGLSIVSGRNEASFKRLESNIQKMMESFRGQIISSPSQPGSDDESKTTTPNSKEKYGWHDPTCKGLGQCKRQGFENPPLVILSFDGFSREYLDRHIMKSLEKMAECGATAERVFPSYPSRTFPNHYSIVTGLYPESHGIADNSVYDPSLSEKLESMKGNSEMASAYYKGDPIWSRYTRETGRPSACQMWTGCDYNASGVPPTYFVPFSSKISFEQRFDQVLRWLNEPSTTRPGLILSYFDEPDWIGHRQKYRGQIDRQLQLLDGLLDKFLSTLQEQGLLECINLLIVSDHGMKVLDKMVYLSDYPVLNNSDIVSAAAAVVACIHRKNTNISLSSLTEPFECNRGEDFRVFTRESMPVRKHYSRDARVGDVILQGRPGVIFASEPSDSSPWLNGNHGYDFIDESMHTVFFARGPGIRPKTVLPGMQNVEYLTLFQDLLGLSPGQSTNGTDGFMYPILMRKPQRKLETKQPIKDCPSSSPNFELFGCGSCASTTLESYSKKLLECSTNLSQYLKDIPQITSNNDVCLENYCNKHLISDKGNDTARAIIEVLTKSDLLSPINDSCPISSRRSDQADKICSEPEGRYLSAINNTEFAQLIATNYNWSQGFIETVLDPLDRLTRTYVYRFEKVVVMTGIAYDRNHDSVADETRSGLPTHLYRILLRCPSGWAVDGFCVDSTKTETVAFVFPTSMEMDINCLNPSALLLEYTARIRDVELISGLELSFPSVPAEEQIRIRTRVNTELW